MMTVAGGKLSRFATPWTARTLISWGFFIVYLAVGVYYLAYHAGIYDVDSPAKSIDLINCKFWLVLSLVAAVIVQSVNVRRRAKPWLGIVLLSVYFIVLYALLYKGTEFGYGGQWGDNGNRLALIEKFRDLPSLFQDWYNKGLPAFYPPLWFFVSGKLAALFDIPAYQTIKYGYFVIYAVYPAALYFVWTRLTRPTVAFAIVFLTIFVRDIYFDFVYYEYIAAAFFIPWWLYYVEDVRGRVAGSTRRMVMGGLSGALIFMTFYYWFFIGIAAALLRAAVSMLRKGRGKHRGSSFGHKIKIGGWCALFSAIYWMPLVLSILNYGFDSMQNKWFKWGEMALLPEYFLPSVIGIFWLTGMVYLTMRRRSRVSNGMILLFAGIAALYLCERVLISMDTTIQTRKLTALLPVFLAVPSGLGLAACLGLARRHSRAAQRLLFGLLGLAVLFWGNEHSEIRNDRNYRFAINDYVREYELEVFRAVDYRERVFLTDKYTQAVYLPYYMFVTHYAPTAHPASRFNERVSFLKYVARQSNPAVVAFLLRRNKFDAVDYFYLPTDSVRRTAYFEVRPIYFPAETPVERIDFPFATTVESPYMTRQAKDLYALSSPDTAVGGLFGQTYDTTSVAALLARYNRREMAVRFLEPRLVDSLRPDLGDAADRLGDSLTIRPQFNFDRDILLSALDLGVSPGRDSARLRLVLQVRTRLRDDLRVFVHVYAENSTQLDEAQRQVGFINVDLRPGLRAREVIAEEYVLFDKALALRPGKYMLHIGLFNDELGRLQPTYRSRWFEVGTPARQVPESADA